MSDNYHQLARTIERMHRRYLDVLKKQLDELEVDDINAAQALMLSNLEDKETSVQQLVERGNYLGANVSYNIKKLVQADYVAQKRAPRDRRAVRMTLTDKGRELRARLYEREADHAKAAIGTGGIPRKDFDTALETLRRVESYWTDMLRYPSIG